MILKNKAWAIARDAQSPMKSCRLIKEHLRTNHMFQNSQYKPSHAYIHFNKAQFMSGRYPEPF